MARRRNRKFVSTPELPFEDARAVILKMEACCCYRTVTCEFTARDVCEWLWPPEIVASLTSAFEYIRALDKSEAVDGSHDILFLSEVNFTLRVREARMCAPERGQIALQDTPKGVEIDRALRQAAIIHSRFMQVNKVVDWLNEHATMGAAKYYFPSLGALLPAAHPFHAAGGDIYREPKRPVAEIAADMREAMTTIAMGLLTYDPAYVHEASTFRVKIDGSQMFCLI